MGPLGDDNFHAMKKNQTAMMPVLGGTRPPRSQSSVSRQKQTRGARWARRFARAAGCDRDGRAPAARSHHFVSAKPVGVEFTPSGVELTQFATENPGRVLEIPWQGEC